MTATLTQQYIPLYRKYRPQTFADLVGQEALVKTLSNAIELKKVAHAYLFTGPRGTGKTSAARIFAKSLNCQEGPTVTPCGKCPSCVDIVNGTPIDIIEIDAASNRKVEDARNLLEKVQFVPVAGKYKIYIIDEVHMLTTEAFNTLLKTLEEPSEHLVFILATTEPHKVLDTIISRCQRFDFRRIKHDTILKRLSYIAQVESIKIEDEALALIARKSFGGLRDAIALLDQAGVLGHTGGGARAGINEQDILSLLGCISEDALFSIADIIAGRDSTNLISTVTSLMQMGNEPLQVLRDLMGYFRNLMLIKTTDKVEEIASLLDISEQFREKLKEQSKKFEVIELAQIIEKLSEHEKLLRNTTSQHLWLEVALISLCHRYDILMVKELEARVKKLEDAMQSGTLRSDNLPAVKQSSLPKIEKPPASRSVSQIMQPAVTPALPTSESSPTVAVTTDKPNTIVALQEKPAEAASTAQETGNLPSLWRTLLENTNAMSNPLYSMFRDQACPVELTPDRAVITFKTEFYQKMAQGEKRLAILEKALEQMFGTVPKLTLRLPLADDEKKTEILSKPEIKEKTLNAVPQTVKQAPMPVQPEKAAIITTPETIDEQEDEILDIIETQQVDLSLLTMSDQTRQAIDLFQGKIIE